MQSSSLFQVDGSVQSRPHTTLRINVPKSRVSHFVDRPAILTGISERLVTCSSEKIVVLLGMGGAGKTQLALDFCRQAEDNLGFTAVIWINASSPASVMQSYKAIAKRMGKGQQNDAKKMSKYQQDDADSEEVISLVQDIFRDRKQPWLFVFDNYDEPKAFQTHRVTHYIPSGKEGRILFTSRHAHSARLGHKINVSDMTENESLKLLLQRPPLDDQELLHGKEIAATLGHLALALDQAGSYIRERNLRLRDFISHYRRRKEFILKAIPEEWEYRRIVNDEEKETNLRIFTTWELSFEQISGNDEEKEQKDHFLSLASFFDVKAISERYFQPYFDVESPKWMTIFSSEGEWDSDKMGDVLAEFHKLSLLQLPEHAVDEQLFSIHPVVRDWIQIRKSRDVRQQFAQEFITTLDIYLSEFDHDDLSFETNQETLLHVDSCVEHDKELLSGTSKWSLEDRQHTVGLFVDLYRHQARHEEAEKLLERALNYEENNLGATHPDTLDTMADLARTYRRQSRYDEAEKLYKRLAANQGKSLGVMHLDTLKTMKELAFIFGMQGRCDKAESLLKQILSHEKRLGVTHLDILGIMKDLATVFEGHSRYDEAKTLFEQDLNDPNKKFGTTHSDTLESIMKLAHIYQDQDRYEEAKLFFTQIISSQKEKVEVAYLEKLHTIKSLGQTYQTQGRYEEAERHFEQVRNGQQETLGATHLTTLLTVGGLAGIYQAQGRYEKAETLFKQVLDSQKEGWEVTHPATMITIRNLADLYHEQRRYEEAETSYKQVLSGYEEKLGATHPDTLNTVRNLATIKGKQGQYDEAEALYKQVLNGQKKKLGAAHPDTLKTIKILGLMYVAQSRNEEAEPLFKKLSSRQKEMLGATHSDTLESIEMLAYIYREQGRHDEAEKLEQGHHGEAKELDGNST